MPDMNPLYEAIVKGDAKVAQATTAEALTRGDDPLSLVNEFMSPAITEVGRRFENNEYFVPELLLSARAMKVAMELVRPLLAARGCKPIGRVVVGTVKGDLHDIGKNLVAAMFEGSGFEVIDLGVNVSPEQFDAAIRENEADIIGLSALLTTTMTAMRTTIRAICQAGLRDQVKVLVGGAPITKRFAEEIGADGLGVDAVEAVAVARQFVTQAA